MCTKKPVTKVGGVGGSPCQRRCGCQGGAGQIGMVLHSLPDHECRLSHPVSTVAATIVPAPPLLLLESIGCRSVELDGLQVCALR